MFGSLMPTIANLFREGRLSYSKVREVTRVVGVVDEQRLAGLALTATASQLARMIAGFRSADGRRVGQQTKRHLSWHEREDGMIEFRARLPKEDAAQVIAAIEAAREQFGPPPAKPDPCGDHPEPAVGSYSNADALVDVALASSTAHQKIAPVKTAPSWWCTSQPTTSPGTFPRERRHRSRRSATSPVSVRSRRRPRKSMPATARCWVRWSTSTARCSPSGGPGGWSVRRCGGRC
jgi:Domain of unknown function (DUF222)